jgi:hypothetical protein
MVQRVVDEFGCVLEKEWKGEKERVKSLHPEKKQGVVKTLGWRIVISFRSLFNVSRERSGGDFIC